MPLTPLEPGIKPILMHLEHTGGTTLKPIIERQYRNCYEIVPTGQYTLEYFMQLPEARRASYDAMVGHLFYGIHRHIPGKTRYITTIRHPLDRILASYNYAATKTNRPNHELYRNRLVKWADHLEQRRDDIRQLTRIIGGDDALIVERRVKTIPQDAVNIAIQHLENDFALVGLQNRYDETLLMMRYVLNWQKPITYVRLNTSKVKLTLKDLSADDRKIIEQAAEAEMPLYEYAQKRFEAQIEAYPGDLARDLAVFRADNARYAEAQARIERLKAPVRALRRTLKKILKRPSST